jgi:anti-sigma factor (TIGR02949 family)
MTHNHEIDCQEILENLNSYIDGDLDEVLCSDIEIHLRACPTCQILVNTLEKTIHIYQTDGQETALPTDIRRRLFTALGLENDAGNE